MALLQISEPGEATAPHAHRHSAGIDLGTTNSLVATLRSGEAVCLPDENGRSLLPSIVNFGDAQTLVGYEAQALQISDPLNSIASIKRLMGRAREDVIQLGDAVPYEFVTSEGSNVPRIRTRKGDLSAVEISAEILKTLAHRATQSIGGDLDGVVITVPAYFDDAQRQATRDAATLAGLNLFRLLNEPTAAAVAYGLDREISVVVPSTSRFCGLTGACLKSWQPGEIHRWVAMIWIMRWQSGSSGRAGLPISMPEWRAISCWLLGRPRKTSLRPHRPIF
jgi:molecular chaperone HscA